MSVLRRRPVVLPAARQGRARLTRAEKRPCSAWMLRAITDIDYDAREVIVPEHAMIGAQGSRLTFAAVEASGKAQLDRFGITELAGEDAFFARSITRSKPSGH